MAYQYPKLRNDLESVRQESQGVVYFVIKDPIAGRFFRIREPEFWLIQQFDGNTSHTEIHQRFAERFSIELPDGAVDTFARKLDELFFLENDRAEYETSRSARRMFGNQKKSPLSKILYIKLRAFDPTEFLNKVLALYRPFHGAVLWFASWLFLAIGATVLWNNRSDFVMSFTEIFTLGSIITVMVSLAIVIFLHEMAHAVTCRLHGGQVREMGFLLLYFEPCFYTDLSDAWLFKRKSHRLAVIWAGPFMQLITLAIAVLIWRVTVPGTFISEVAQISAVVCLITILFNFNPLIKLDGYYLLSDWIEIPNLRDKAFEYWGARAKRALLGIPIPPRDGIEYTRREKRVFFWYATLAIVYTAALLGYLLYLVGSWAVSHWGGFGAVVVAAVPMYILRREITGAFSYLAHPITAMKNIFASPVRAAVYSIIVILLALLFFAAPFTQTVSGPVAVHPLQQFTITSIGGGTIKTELQTGGARPDLRTSFLNMSSLDLSALDFRTLVTAGDNVGAGDTLLKLTSNQVTAELAASRSRLDVLEAKLALLKSPPKSESLLVLENDAQALESEYRRADADLTRKRELFNKNLIARNELENAESAFNTAKARWEAARSIIALYKSPPKPQEEAVIRSDIRQQQAEIDFLESQAAAQVIASPIPGRAVTGSNSNVVISIVNDQQAEALVSVSDYDIEKIEVGQTVKMKIRSFPAETFVGVVSRVSHGGEMVAGAGQFEVATLFDNQDLRLRPGMSGYAKIEIGQRSLFSICKSKIGSLIRVEFWSWW